MPLSVTVMDPTCHRHTNGISGICKFFRWHIRKYP
uniref:Uncharacterized protein n=1 Tax=Arundo donax TaxID=35708 RepID=A0A0A9FKL3_ARUDO